MRQQSCYQNLCNFEKMIFSLYCVKIQNMFVATITTKSESIDCYGPYPSIELALQKLRSCYAEEISCEDEDMDFFDGEIADMLSECEVFDVGNETIYAICELSL